MSEAEDVRALASGLGLDSIVDVHTHFMPRRVLDKVWAYFDRAGPLTGQPWPITYRLAEADRIDRLRTFGVERFSSLVYPHKPNMAEWLNEWAAGFAAGTPDCIHTATFYPEPGADAYVGRAIDGGARLFKSHVQVGDYSPTAPELEPVWARLEQAAIPTVIHAGSGPAPGKFTGAEPVAEVLRRHPGLNLIVAHMGLPDYREFFDLAHRYPGVRLDTTMVFTDFTERTAPFPADLERDLAALGDKILFGSDFPNIPYTYLHALRSVVDRAPSADWCRKVLRDNARQLFGSPSAA